MKVFCCLSRFSILARRPELLHLWSLSAMVVDAPLTTCRLLLGKFYIGDLDEADRSSPGIVEYVDNTQEREFYDVLKRRVEKFFRGNEVTP